MKGSKTKYHITAWLLWLCAITCVITAGIYSNLLLAVVATGCFWGLIIDTLFYWGVSKDDSMEPGYKNKTEKALTRLSFAGICAGVIAVIIGASYGFGLLLKKYFLDIPCSSFINGYGFWEATGCGFCALSFICFAIFVLFAFAGSD